MSFQDISYLELWRPFCSAERTFLRNFGRGHYEEQFCEFILNLGQWFRRKVSKGAKIRNQLKLFKKVLIWSSGSPPIQWSGTIHAILNEGIMGNIHAKLYEI